MYRSITELPLKNYIDGTVNGNVSAIIKSGVCLDEGALIDAWQDINQQYSEAIGDQTTRLYLSLFKETTKLSVDIEKVAHLVKALSMGYVKQFADALNKTLHTSFKFDISNPEAYDKDLQRCLKISKGFQLQLDLKLSQFTAMQSKETKGQAPDHAYYQSILLTLSEHLKYEVSENISVFKFCEMVKRLNKYVEEAKK